MKISNRRSVRRVKQVFASKQGWRTIGDKRIYFRSQWEAKYAKYLQFLKEQNLIKEWEYEPQKFWFEAIKSGTRCYTPDFKVTENDESWHWIEVKGYMDPKSATKIKRFKKYYPNEELYVLDRSWFVKNISKMPIDEGL